MESLKKLLQKIEQPLSFASKDNYKNLSHIKDLGKSLLKMLTTLKSSLPPTVNNDALSLIEELLKIFSDYDWQKVELKKTKIEKAQVIWEKLKKAIDSLPATASVYTDDPQTIQRVSDLREALSKLTLPVQYLKGVGPKMAQRLLAKKINTVEDLLYFLPRTYEDRREIKKINHLEAGKIQTVAGSVVSVQYKYYGKKRILEVTISDNTANLTAKWFKGQMSYLLGVFKNGTRVIFTGEARPNYTGKVMIHPEYEILEEDEAENLLNFKRIVPIYSETEGLHQKYLRKIMYQALENYARYVVSPIPADICQKRNLPNIQESLISVHFPENNKDLEAYNSNRSPAHRRLIYDEFFFFQLGMAIKKTGRILDAGIKFNIEGTLLNKFLALLPFDLTEAQKRVINEIHDDLAKETAMNRLLQGDVGSGKTIVSMAAMVTACENSYQAAIMAPTEILAQQHYQNIQNWASALGLKAVLLIGGLNTAQRKETLDKIISGEANIIIGTHALISEDVGFHKLGLVVIDEQHRFGVMQRATLRGKGINADVLVMTATPIPRTLAMTVYGDLDISVIDEMPPGKKPVRTVLMGENKREDNQDQVCFY